MNDAVRTRISASELSSFYSNLDVIAEARPGPSIFPAGGSHTTLTAKIFVNLDRIVSVLQSPRCINCHASNNRPAQSDDRHVHLFNVQRGDRDAGRPSHALLHLPSGVGRSCTGRDCVAAMRLFRDGTGHHRIVGTLINAIAPCGCRRE